MKLSVCPLSVRPSIFSSPFSRLVVIQERLAELSDLCTLKDVPREASKSARKLAEHTLNLAPHLLKVLARSRSRVRERERERERERHLARHDPVELRGHVEEAKHVNPRREAARPQHLRQPRPAVLFIYTCI